MTFCLDEDEVGQVATAELAAMLTAKRFTAPVVTLPAKDPNEVLRHPGRRRPAPGHR